ncbi:hypothetical protein SEA_JUMBO_100 [Gordonia phage Jumbo]|uniref:Uncharacterized protein n=1 Tax=Gordonia phage Jumbo TaxID=1887650 RepID=A0A1B3B0Q4_9CAUD|nr:hypothetical protein BIZ69_gp100 [Gordonia phage Jumbo]AOE44607.1 hypothetical protein SEA_JUMBO_100 [Gordonia phage Jumbo]
MGKIIRVCTLCAVYLNNADDSAHTPEEIAAIDATLAAIKKDWNAPHVFFEHSDETDCFRCDLCSDDCYGESHVFTVGR